MADPEKVYHLPDWDRAEKGTTLTDWALCGQYVNTSGDAPHHWFGARPSVINCEKCKEVRDG